MTREGLIAEYLFTGSANDTSGGARHGIVYGATPANDRFGNANCAFHFDGIDDFITIDPPPQIDDKAMSVSVWVRYDPRDLDGWTNSIIAQDDGNDEDQSRRVFQISTLSGRVVWHRMMGARDPMCKLPVRSGIWMHLAAVYENGEHRIYLDGEAHDSVQHRFWVHPDQPIHIGRKGTDEPYFFFKGDIDDVRLYNRALGSGEIRELFEENGWRPAASPGVAPDALSGRWGRRGVIFLDLRCDGSRSVTGRIMARDPGHMAPIEEGTFDASTGALRLAGTAIHPDDGSPVPYVIEGRLMDGEVTVVATFTAGEPPQVNAGNYILTKPGAQGGWWRNSRLRWRLLKMARRLRR